MSVINIILDVNITLGIISLLANLYVLAILIFGNPYDDEEEK